MSQLDPVSTTVGDLCNAALKECGAFGIGQTPLAEDTTDAWARLQWMLQQWQEQRWMVYHLRDYSIVSTGAKQYTFGPNGQINTNLLESFGLDSLELNAPGAGYAVNDTITLLGGNPNSSPGSVAGVLKVTAIGGGGAISAFTIQTIGSYTIPMPTTFTQQATSGGGANATFNNPTYNFIGAQTVGSGPSKRPAKLEAAFLRQLVQSQPNNIDYPLRILQSYEDYAQIALKSLVSFPGCVFMDSDWPLSIVYPYPVPNANIYALHLIVREQLPMRFPTLATVVTLPPEYYDAIVFNLAIRLKSKYQIPSFPGDPLPGLAKSSLNIVRGPNVQIQELPMPQEVRRDGLYNIYSDRNY